MYRRVVPYRDDDPRLVRDEDGDSAATIGEVDESGLGSRRFRDPRHDVASVLIVPQKVLSAVDLDVCAGVIVVPAHESRL